MKATLRPQASLGDYVIVQGVVSGIVVQVDGPWVLINTRDNVTRWSRSDRLDEIRNDKMVWQSAARKKLLDNVKA